MFLDNEETEEVEQVLEVGVDPSELYASQETQELVIVHNNKTWVFKYRDLSWKEKYDGVDSAATMDGDDVGYSIGTYYIVALEKMLIDSPIKPITETTLSKLDKDVGAQLVSIVPAPADPAMIAGLKKG